MPILSVGFHALLWVAIAIGITSLLAKRFAWRSIWVYAVIVAGVAEILVDLITGVYFLGSIVWIAVVIASLFPSVRVRLESLFGRTDV
ncbi:hypothetical protein KC953_03440 [Candidatus Saccharibacteria bacterium]|nr:hypothetical protein [Candidatus Saccharibacteria bacterium]